MKLKQLLQSYEFDELMPVIADMFPGTNKYRKPLEQAYDMIISTHAVTSNKPIKYKILHGDKADQSYIGAEDADFNATWEVCLGKEVVKDRGVDLSQVELAANSLINLCFISRYPTAFGAIHEQLIK